MKNKYGLKSSTKYDWTTIDCSKMPDYEVKKPAKSGYGYYDNNFWGQPWLEWNGDTITGGTNGATVKTITCDHVSWTHGFDIDDLTNNGTR